MRTEQQILERTKEIQNFVGKDVNVMVTGMMVKGKAIEYISEDHSHVLVVEHTPVSWGNQKIQRSHIWERKSDDFGPMKYTEVL